MLADPALAFAKLRQGFEIIERDISSLVYLEEENGLRDRGL